MSEKRLVGIETKLAYQEDTLQTLNDVVSRQQMQIDQLERTCKLLLERLEEITKSGSPGESNGNEAPPHY